MKKLMFATAALAAMVLVLVVVLGRPAEAGSKAVSSVVVNTGTRTASGFVGSTRNSPDSSSFLTCTVSGFSSGALAATCRARDAAGRELFCFSSVPAIVAAAQAINGDSDVFFTADASGFCTEITSGNTSLAEPKLP